MAQKNPVVQRLERLSDQWAEFAVDEDARLLCWLFEQDELRMGDAFLAAQEDERTSTHPDVFLTLETPFENPFGHGYSLYETWMAGYLASREALEAQGVAADWQPRAYDRAPNDDVAFLLERCQSFIAHYQLNGHLVLVLRPSAVSDPAAYLAWLQRLVRDAPANVRVLVFDHAERPVYAPLVEAEPQRVRAVPTALDMPGALQDISRHAGRLDTPGGQFRHLFVKLGAALKKQDLPMALQLGDAALVIATAQGWWHLAVPVHFALGAGLIGAQRTREAVAQYTAAEAAATRGETEAPEEARAACKSMRLQARLGCGSALVHARAWTMAAKHYEETAPLAAESGDTRALLDCHRLASFCHEQAGADEAAFRAGMNGLEVARQMDRETLATSSFPYLGEGLMRLTSRGELQALQPTVEREIVLIAGTRDWRPKGAAPASVPAAAPAVPSVSS